MKEKATEFLTTLGIRPDPLAVANSAILAIISLFYIYSSSSYVAVIIYPLVNRVTYYSHFNIHLFGAHIDNVIITFLTILWFWIAFKNRYLRISGVSILTSIVLLSLTTDNSMLLQVIALLSLPTIGLLILVNKVRSDKILRSLPSSAVSHILIISIVIASATITEHVISQGSSNFTARNYVYEIFLVFSSFSPFLILPLISYYPVRYLITILKKSKASQFSGVIKIVNVPSLHKAIYLTLIVILALALAIIPHLPSVNKNGQNVGVDTGYYVTWVTALRATTNASEFLQEAFVNQAGGDRPATLIILYALSTLTDNALARTIEFFPLILAPSLAIVTYFLTREIIANDKIAIISSFLTAVSFQTLIGIYAGFYANWLAIIVGYVAIVIFFRIIKYPTATRLSIFSVLIFVLLLSHVYTWTIILLAMGAYLIFLTWTRTVSKRTVSLLFIILLSSVAVDIVRVVLTGSSGGIGGDIELASKMTGPDQFAKRWGNLSYTANIFVGGIFGNFIIFGLALFWLYESSKIKASQQFIPIFLSLGILPFLFGDWVVQTRVFYDIPFQIPAAIGLYSIRQHLKSRLIIYSVCLWSIIVAIRTVSNFYLILP